MLMRREVVFGDCYWRNWSGPAGGVTAAQSPDFRWCRHCAKAKPQSEIGGQYSSEIKSCIKLQLIFQSMHVPCWYGWRLTRMKLVFPRHLRSQTRWPAWGACSCRNLRPWPSVNEILSSGKLNIALSLHQLSYHSEFIWTDDIDDFPYEEVDDLQTPDCRSLVEGCLKFLARATDVGTAVQENLDHPNLVVGAGQMQRRQLLLVSSLYQLMKCAI